MTTGQRGEQRAAEFLQRHGYVILARNYRWKHGEIDIICADVRYLVFAEGVVSATVNGKHELKSLTIDPEAVDPEDVEMLQDMIVAAVNEAMRSADTDASETMQKLTGGLGLPF